MPPSKELIHRLHRVRRTLRRTVVESSVSRLVALVAAGFLLAALIDFALRLPSAVRLVVLAAGLAWLGVTFSRRILPAIRFRPSLVDVALRIEAANPPLVGRLASGVDFATTGAAEKSPLAERAIREVGVRMGAVRFDQVARTGPAHRVLAIAMAMVAVVVAIGVLRPVDAGIAARRILLPLGDARWPALTEVTSALDPRLVHPRGEPLAMSADLLKGDPESTRVSVRMRRVRDGVAEDWRTLVLTPQTGGRFERVVETDADAIEYVFATNDWETIPGRVELIPAPSVIEARVTVRPPSHAARLAPVESELGPGTDRRSRLGRAVLEGSLATLRLELERPVPIRRLDDGRIDPEFTLEVLDPPRRSAETPTLEVDPSDPLRWTISWTLDQGGELGVALVDEHGLRNLDPIGYRIDTIPDRGPSITIVEPASDRAVTPVAVVPLHVEAQDDVGLSMVRLDAAVRRAGIVSGTSEIFAVEIGGLETQVADRRELSVDALGVEVGDDIELVATAFDERPDADPTTSATRRLRVVAESTIVEQLQGGLAAVRRDALRLDDDQARLQDATREDRSRPGQVREQGRIGDRVEGARETIDALQGRQEENRVEDEILDEVLDQAAGLLEAASRASERAVAALDRGSQAREREARAAAEGDRPAEAQAAAEAERAEREADEAQRDVRDELADLAATLDRGEDAWVVSRRIDQLSEDLAELQERTAELAEQTMGRDREDLSEDERRELDDVVREQSELAERSEELVDELDRRAEALERADPIESEGLREAAREARRQGLEERMREAEEGARENRLQQAGASQQQAAEALEQMQETIEEARKARVEELRRRMESLVDSLQGLIKAAEDEVIALAQVEGPEDRDGLAARAEAMIRLQRNTLAVASEATSADERIGRLVARAAEHQAASIGDLRTDPSDLDAARESEERGLASLREALELAQAAAERLAEEQADAERARLLAAYRLMLETQTGIRVETERLVPAEGERLGRRGLMASRRLATDEEALGESMRALREEFAAVEDSLVFSMTHRNLDAWIAEAASRLRDGRPDAVAIERETMVIEAIGGLIEAIDRERQPPDDPFGQQQAGGAGGEPGGDQGNQPQPLIPPIAELKMLRTLQMQVLDATRRLDRSSVEGEDREARLAELSRMQSDLHGVGSALLSTLEPEMMGPPSQEKRPGPEGAEP